MSTNTPPETESDRITSKPSFITLEDRSSPPMLLTKSCTNLKTIVTDLFLQKQICIHSILL